MPLSTLPATTKSVRHTTAKKFPSSHSSAAVPSSSSSTAYSPLVLDLRLPQLETVTGDSLIGSDLAAFSPNTVRCITPPPPPRQPLSPAQVPIVLPVKPSRRGRISSEIPIIVDARKAYIRPSAPFRASNYTTPTTKRNATLPAEIPPFLKKKKSMQSSSETVVANYGTSSPSGSIQKPSVVTPAPGPVDESSPLLSTNETEKKKPFYRARPLWYVINPCSCHSPSSQRV